jgi:indolepyruvate ferredoxin oxidoreductase, beta subunit
MTVYNVLIVGIGGQGVILASNVLGEACIAEGVTVRCSETHGMAQRGGSVESHVRIGGRFSPLIPPGTADLILAFELLEALRYRHYLREGGTILANDHLIVPTSVYVQKLPLPSREEVLQRLKDSSSFILDARRMALEAGSPLTLNMVMTGAASPFLPLRRESLEAGLRTWVPPKTVAMNLKAFERGRAEVLSLR